MLEILHRLLAYGTVAAVASGIAWSVLIVTRGGPRPEWFERFQPFVVGLLGLTALVGAGELLSNGRPGEDLHLVYAVIAIGLLPLARSFVPEADRRRATLVFAAFVVLGGLVFRLFGTG